MKSLLELLPQSVELGCYFGRDPKPREFQKRHFFTVLLLGLLSCAIHQSIYAGVGGVDKQSLQKGAHVFFDYCYGCHSLNYVNYNQLQQDLGIKALAGIPKLQGNMMTALSVEDAKSWFGVIPPDLSLKAREKGADWLYRYFNGFYPDHTRPFGVNNTLMPDVAMPHVLASVPEEQYEETLNELINFLTYAAQPEVLVRYQMGIYVLLFLFVFLVLSYALKKSYWKNL